MVTIGPREEGEPTYPRVTRIRDSRPGTIVGGGETVQRDGTMQQQLVIVYDDGTQDVDITEAEITRS